MNARPSRPTAGPRFGLARVLSKLGYCSRSQAVSIIRAGRVSVNGTVRTDPEFGVTQPRDEVRVDGEGLRKVEKVYLALNKPRGLVTTASDEQGRATVFQCLGGLGLPFLSPVGRLDRASEGLLLFTNDTAWAAGITGPATHLPKTYHVQIDRVADATVARMVKEGVVVDGEVLRARQVVVLRQGTKTSWLEIVLEEGRNRHIRRLLEALGMQVLRLVRVAIGPLVLGTLAKGQTRILTKEEVAGLRR